MRRLIRQVLTSTDVHTNALTKVSAIPPYRVVTLAVVRFDTMRIAGTASRIGLWFGPNQVTAQHCCHLFLRTNVLAARLKRTDFVRSVLQNVSLSFRQHTANTSVDTTVKCLLCQKLCRKLKLVALRPSVKYR